MLKIIWGEDGNNIIVWKEQLEELYELVGQGFVLFGFIEID